MWSKTLSKLDSLLHNRTFLAFWLGAVLCAGCMKYDPVTPVDPDALKPSTLTPDREVKAYILKLADTADKVVAGIKDESLLAPGSEEKVFEVGAVAAEKWHKVAFNDAVGSVVKSAKIIEVKPADVPAYKAQKLGEWEKVARMLRSAGQ